MNEPIPRRPTGTTPEALFDQAVWDKAHGPRSHWKNTSTVRVNKTTKGFSLHIRPQKGKSVAGTTAKILYFQNSQADYINCSDSPTVNGDLTGVVLTPVAKLFKLRNSIALAVIDTVIHTYDYTGYAGFEKYVRRTVTIPQVGSIKQVIVPRLLVNDEITVLKIPVTVKDNTGLVDFPCDYLMVGPHHWSDKADQST